jgi:PAS domain S-box-containing protein
MTNSSDNPVADPIADASVSADLLVSFLKAFPGRAWIKDGAGRFVYASDSLLAAFGLKREEVIGVADESRFPHYARSRTRRAQLVLSNRQPMRATEVTKENGQTKYLFVVRFPLDFGGAHYVGGLAIEMTEEVSALEGLHRVNQQLFRSERLRSVGELASGIAHDINNSLNAMVLGIELLRAEKGKDATTSRRIDRLGRVVKDAAARVTRLQDVVQERSDEPLESLDLRSVIEEAVEMVHFVVEKSPTPGGGTIKVSFEVPALRPVLGHVAELRHVFANLLLNARDALPSGGSIVIKGELLDDAIVISVADDGIGIPKDLIGKIFDPLFTTKSTGTGLGLSMARDVMTRMGGTITADSQPRGGAVFTLRFPLPRATTRSESRPRVSEPAAAVTSHSILIVDDHEDSLVPLRTVLELRGQNVETAASGKEALAKIHSGTAYDVVLCDLNLNEMDGWAVAEEVSRIANGPEFYLMTGWLPDLADSDPRRALARDILSKPIDLERLFRILDGIE